MVRHYATLEHTDLIRSKSRPFRPATRRAASDRRAFRVNGIAPSSGKARGAGRRSYARMAKPVPMCGGSASNHGVILPQLPPDSLLRRLRPGRHDPSGLCSNEERIAERACDARPRLTVPEHPHKYSVAHTIGFLKGKECRQESTGVVARESALTGLIFWATV